MKTSSTTDPTPEERTTALLERLKITATITPTDRNDAMDTNTDMDHWRVHLVRENGHDMTITYSTGIGHRRGDVPVAPPLADVMYSLILEADVDGYTFEEWCGDVGYDTDSRRAERVYHLCLQQTIQLKRLLGDEFVLMRDAVQDY